MLNPEGRQRHVDSATAKDFVVALLNLAVADEIKRGGMIGQMGFQDLFPWRGLAPPASLEGMADQRWRDGEMECGGQNLEVLRLLCLGAVNTQVKTTNDEPSHPDSAASAR